MTGPNALSYNQWVQQVATMAVVQAAETSGVWAFSDPAMATITPMILNYAELRIARDVNMLSSMTSNTYTLTAGAPVFSLNPGDFLTVQTCEICQISNGNVVSSTPLIPVSKEFIQNCYSGLSSSGQPKYFAMYGDNFGDEQDTATNIVFGPAPSYGFSLRVTGTARQPSLYTNAVSGIADTEYTYISQWFPDLLLLASMIYISGFQRNFSATSADVEMAMSWEKQYQLVRIGAIQEEDRRRQQGSGWTAYGTPTSATPTR